MATKSNLCYVIFVVACHFDRRISYLALLHSLHHENFESHKCLSNIHLEKWCVQEFVHAVSFPPRKTCPKTILSSRRPRSKTVARFSPSVQIVFQYWPSQTNARFRTRFPGGKGYCGHKYLYTPLFLSFISSLFSSSSFA